LAEPRIESVGLENGACPVAVRRWTPDGYPRGSILMLHGIQSHGGWYLNSCGQLADAGFGVLLPDRRGSGLNPIDRGDAPSFRRLLDDVAELMQTISPPRILVGISWGGKLAVAFQRRHPGLTDGLVLITPGLCQRVGLSFIQRLRVAASRFVAPRRSFPIPLNEPELFTANPEKLEFIRDDPYALRRATARLLFESARMTVYNHWAVRHVSVPTLLLLAEHDRIIDNSKTRRRAERFACRDVTIHEFPGASHTLEFEPGGPPPFVADLLRWIEQRNLARTIKQPNDARR
jgi:alpha-beta hydrolase superfamily lysophospholipase